MPVVKLNTPSSWMAVYVDIILREMEHYLDTINSQFDKILSDFTKRVDDQAKKITDERERDEFYEWHSDDYWKYKETFPRLFLNSLFVSIYSIFETQLDQVAKRLQSHKKEVFSLTDIKKGDYIESSKKYIQSLTSINMSGFSTWEKLRECQNIRNIIVHGNGKTENRDWINKAKQLGIWDDEYKGISISKAYAKEFIKNLRALFSELFSEFARGKHM